jgi:hypothetical protein
LFTLSSFPRSSGLPRPRRSEETCPSSRWLGGAIWQIALNIVGFLGSSAARRSRCDGRLTNSDEEDDVDVHSAGALRGADLVLALVAALQRQALIDDHASPSGRERRHSQLQRDLPVIFFERWRLRAAIVRQSSQPLGPFCRPPCHKRPWSGPASKGLDPLGGACGDLHEFLPLLMPLPEQRRASEQYGSWGRSFYTQSLACPARRAWQGVDTRSLTAGIYPLRRAGRAAAGSASLRSFGPPWGFTPRRPPHPSRSGNIECARGTLRVGRIRSRTRWGG